VESTGALTGNRGPAGGYRAETPRWRNMMASAAAAIDSVPVRGRSSVWSWRNGQALG